MSEKQVLILLHGMGVHTSESFKKEVVDGANNALKRYASYKDINFNDKVHIRSISYDHLFENMRKEMKESGSGIQEFIKNKLGGVNLPGYFDELLNIEASLGDDEFIYTHVLDVIFYISLLSESVRLYVCKKILEVMSDYQETTSFNILAHSLGTAVAHDALDKLFTTGPSTNIELNVDEHKLRSIWLIANVSNIITHFSGLTGPYESLVKPGEGGCTVKLYNGFNRFDPFTLKVFKRFDPDNSNNWLEDAAFKFRYKRLKTEKVSRANTHDIMGYLEDPVICHPFLNHFFDFKPDENEKATGDAAYKNIQDEAEKINNHITAIETGDDLIAFIKMIKSFQDYLKP